MRIEFQVLRNGQPRTRCSDCIIDLNDVSGKVIPLAQGAMAESDDVIAVLLHGAQPIWTDWLILTVTLEINGWRINSPRPGYVYVGSVTDAPSGIITIPQVGATTDRHLGGVHTITLRRSM